MNDYDYDYENERITLDEQLDAFDPVVFKKYIEKRAKDAGTNDTFQDYVQKCIDVNGGYIDRAGPGYEDFWYTCGTHYETNPDGTTKFVDTDHLDMNDIKKYNKKGNTTALAKFFMRAMLRHLNKMLFQKEILKGCPDDIGCKYWRFGTKRCECERKDVHGWDFDDAVFYNFTLYDTEIYGFQTFNNKKNDGPDGDIWGF